MIRVRRRHIAHWWSGHAWHHAHWTMRTWYLSVGPVTIEWKVGWR